MRLPPATAGLQDLCDLPPALPLGAAAEVAAAAAALAALAAPKGGV